MSFLSQNKRFTTCPLCKKGELVPLNKQAKDYITEKSFVLKQCRHCESVQTVVMDLSSLDVHYGNAYYNNAKGKFSPLFEKIFRWNHKRNAKLLYKQLHPQKVLEIGCGRAYLLRELKELGVDVYALESNAAADWILNNDAVKVVSIPDAQTDKWPFEPSFFQLVIYWHVLEHLSDPAASLQQAANVLDEGGMLCVSIPNISSYQAKMSLTTWFHLDVPRHFFHFSRKGILQLLEQSGFEIVDVQSGDSIQNLYGWLQSLANFFTPGNTNGLYRLLQGGKPLRTASKLSIVLQLMTAFIWVPLGILGWTVEALSGKTGNITVYARKAGQNE